MSGKIATTKSEEQLILQSQISELVRISPWIEHLASQHAIPKEIQFAMNLCLEEALSNIMRYGYAGAKDRSIVIGYSTPKDGTFRFVIEDEAPKFNPIEATEPPIPTAQDNARLGGQGIRLLRHFADSLQYEATPAGNRLSITFLAGPRAKQ